MPFNRKSAAEAGKKSRRSKDKLLSETRERFLTLLEDNTPRIQKWIDEVAKDDPAKAIELFLKIASFSIPKPKWDSSELIKNKDDLSKVPDWLKS